MNHFLSRQRAAAAPHSAPLRKNRSDSHAPTKQPNPFGTLVLAVLQAALIALATYYITGRIDTAFKDRQTTLTAAKDMAELVSKMQEETSVETYTTRARQIAMFGADAIRPLTMMAAQGSFSESIPLSALKLVAIHHRAQVCESLAQAIESGFVGQRRLPAMVEFKGTLQCESHKPWWRLSS